MTDDDPNYARREARRLRVIALTFVAGYAVSAASLYPLCSHLVGAFGYFAAMAVAALISFLPAGGLAVVAHHAHKSFWPEHPDEEEPR